MAFIMNDYNHGLSVICTHKNMNKKMHVNVKKVIYYVSYKKNKGWRTKLENL